MRAARPLFLVIAMGCSLPAASAELYVVRVGAVSALNSGECVDVSWRDNILLYNSTADPLTVRLLEVSNGGLSRPPAIELQVPPGKSVNSAGRINWIPASGDPVWVNRIDVPEGIVLRSRVEAGLEALCGGGRPPSPNPDFGSFSLPTFERLTPAGTPQVLLGADLGAQPSTVNVGVYNDGLKAATASVEVYQVCNDALLESLNFSIPAKALRQVGGVGMTETSCPFPGSEQNAWMRYVKITVDQPGFSYIVNRSKAIPYPPVIPYSSP
jgi:hypothetical protein